MQFLKSIKLNGLLSFAPDSDPIPLAPLNVLIGPNGSGKSNFIEAIELLHAAPTAFADAIRDGGGVREWLWKGNVRSGHSANLATIEALTHPFAPVPGLRYLLTFTESAQRADVIDEVVENELKLSPEHRDVFFYYRYQKGHPVLNVRQGTTDGQWIERKLERQALVPDESVMSQRKDPDLYPELTWLGQRFGSIQTFREWSFGRYARLRQAQPTNTPGGTLLPDARNLGLLLNQIEHTETGQRFNRLMKRFLPRYERFSVRLQDGTVQIYLHESGLAPVSATRLSDGTMRFLALLAVLLTPDPPPLICIEEPELGLHPDAMSILAELLVDASNRSQLVVTTHSDILISSLTEHADSVLVCENVDGTVLTRVDSNKLRYWLDRYRLGEIWRIGELGGNL